MLTGTLTVGDWFYIFLDFLGNLIKIPSCFLLSKAQPKHFSVSVPDRLSEICKISTAMTLYFMPSRLHMFRSGLILCVCLSRVSSSSREPLDWRSRTEIGKDPGWRADMGAETAMRSVDSFPMDPFLPRVTGAHQKVFSMVRAGTHNANLRVGYLPALWLGWVELTIFYIGILYCVVT